PERARELRLAEDQQRADHLRPRRSGLGRGADHDVTVPKREAEPPRAVAALLLIAARQLPARTREMAGVGVCVAPEVVLVFGLGLPERAGLADLGDDRAGPQAGGVDVGDRGPGNLALLFVRAEDLGPVLRAGALALAAPGRRVMDLEEELQD